MGKRARHQFQAPRMAGRGRPSGSGGGGSATVAAERQAGASLESLAVDGSAQEWAEELVLHYGSKSCPVFLAEQLAGATSVLRVGQLAGAALAFDPESAPALSFAAQAAALAGDHAAATQFVERLSEQIAVLAVRAMRARILEAAGRLADALEQIDEVCSVQPEDRTGQMLRARLLSEAERRRELDPSGACPCGSGMDFGSCCSARESAALAKFADDRQFQMVQAAVTCYVGEQPNFAKAATGYWADTQQRWFGQRDVFAGLDEVGLCLDWALTTIGPANGQPISTLAAYADEAAQPPRLRGLAQQWLAGFRFGLWQAARVHRGPGTAFIDLITGLFVYAPTPAGFENAPAWAAFVGAMIPLNGAWWPGRGLVMLSPTEADAFVARALDLVDDFLAQAPPIQGGAASSSRRRTKKIPRDARVAPPGLLAWARPPIDPEVGAVMAKVLQEHIPDLAVSARMGRAEQRNADQEPVEYIEARIQVADGPAVRAALRARPDIKVLGSGEMWWAGRTIWDEKAHQTPYFGPTMDQKRATIFPAGRTGARDLVLAVFRTEKEAVALSVDSRSRYAAFLAMLRTVDPSAEVISEVSQVPGRVAIWERGEPGQGASAEEVAEWERTWPDLPLAATGGLSPRRAAASRKQRLELELVLRTLSFHVDVARRKGQAVPDVDALRAELGMPDPITWPPPFALLSSAG